MGDHEDRAILVIARTGCDVYKKGEGNVVQRV